MHSARTGVHGADQHKVGGKGESTLSTTDGDRLILQGLAQYFQHGMAEFRELIKEEHSAVAKTDPAWFRLVSATDQTGVGNRIVGSAEWTLPD